MHSNYHETVSVSLLGNRLWALMCLWLIPMVAMAKTDRPASRPVVIVFQDAAAPAQCDVDAQFLMALKLALDRFSVHAIDVSGEPFADLPLSKRLEVIAGHTKKHRAVASIWLEYTESDKILLHLVAIGTGRALVRIIEAQDSPSAGEELAFAAQELLGEAYLFETSRQSDAVTQTVAQVKQQIPSPSEPPHSSLSLMPFFELGRGITGHTGPSLHMGGGMDIYIPIKKMLFTRFGAGGASGPNASFNASFNDGILTTRSAFIRTSAGFQKRIRTVSIAPFVGASGTCHWVALLLGEGDRQTFTRFGVRLFAGLHLSQQITANMHIFAEGTVGAQPMRDQFHRLSDDSIAVASPFFDWTASVGVRIAL